MLRSWLCLSLPERPEGKPGFHRRRKQIYLAESVPESRKPRSPYSPATCVSGVVSSGGSTVSEVPAPYPSEADRGVGTDSGRKGLLRKKRTLFPMFYRFWNQHVIVHEVGRQRM